MILLDRSGSCAQRPDLSSRIAALHLEALLADLRADDLVAVIAFGDGARLVEPWRQRASLVPARLDGIASAFPLALRGDTRLDERANAILDQLEEKHHIDEIAILSDAEMLAPVALGGRDSSWRLERLERPEVLDAGIAFDGLAPRCRPGEPVRVRIALRLRGSSAARIAGVSFGGDCAGEAFASQVRELRLRPGRLEWVQFRFLPARAGVAALHASVRLEGGGDRIPANDRATATLAVEGGLRVGWLSRSAAPARSPRGSWALIPLQVERLEALLGDLDVLWIDDLEAATLPAQQVVGFVRRGGALILSGLERQFEGGGYDQPPWPAILPVAPDPQSSPRRILVLLDLSGSMDGEKLLAARGALEGLRGEWGRAAQVEMAWFRDAVGAFKTLKEGGATTARPLEQLWPALRASGSTHLLAALDAALEHLAGAAPALIVAITDGWEEDPAVVDRPAAAAEFAGRLARARARLAVLAVGRRADMAFLRALVGRGSRGRAVRVEEPAGLAAELRRGLAMGRIERGRIPVRIHSSIAGFPAQLEDLGARRRARARSGAQVQVSSSSGEPVIATWRVDQGALGWIGTDLDSGLNAWLAGPLPAALVRYLGPRSPRGHLEFLRGAPLALRWVDPRTPAGRGAVYLTIQGEPQRLALYRSGARSFAAVLPPRLSAGRHFEVIDGAGTALARGRIPRGAAPEYSPLAPHYPLVLPAGAGRRSAPAEGGGQRRIGLLLAWCLAIFVLLWRGRGSSSTSHRPKH